MSFQTTAAHSSRIKKSNPASARRPSCAFSSLPRRKPIARAGSSSKQQSQDDYSDDDTPSSSSSDPTARLPDAGLIHTLLTDLTLRDVPQAILHITTHTFTPIPPTRSGLSSTRTAEILNFRRALPPVATVSHVQALLHAPTAVAREIAELTAKGTIRKLVIPGRGGAGELLILTRDLEGLINSSTTLDDAVKAAYIKLLREQPTALKLPRSSLSQDAARQLMQAGFITAATPTWTAADVFSAPGQGARGTLASLTSIASAARGGVGKVGNEGVVHAAGGSGGRAGSSAGGMGDYSVSVPNVGAYLKLLTSARTHLVGVLGKTRFREMTEEGLRERWEGGVEGAGRGSEARRDRGEFGVARGRTRWWRVFWGVEFGWVVRECVGAGMVEVFETGSVGRGVRVI
ncbi:hypothetical protein VE01_03345 [Pseudogymnoascus verrucosus]|uniref:Serine-threonine protein kinase 19 n=1 Tax=Pseudogymnoascus verrucosus TaxID=342668 RepID=A0A1B8GSL6_9PEZI|nr:uncharacterized protein VE01_03345 [Pseudogymnoascus verrucosus]OBT98832.1 hypothetical protein VE01_03345 [Pseudogymnoascus verrucosus]